MFAQNPFAALNGVLPANPVRKRFDILGMVLFLLMLTPLIAASKFDGVLRPLLLVGAAGFAIVFVRWESRADDPIQRPWETLSCLCLPARGSVPTR